MRRRWNWALWVGFLTVLIGFFSYQFFVLFPITRDFPWLNLLLFAIGGVLLIFGLCRAFGQPGVYRGRIIGPILTTLSVSAIALFCYGLFYIARQMPASASAPRIGQTAPDFTLPDQDGKAVALHDLLNSSSTRAVLLIFYRGFW